MFLPAFRRVLSETFPWRWSWDVQIFIETFYICVDNLHASRWRMSLLSMLKTRNAYLLTRLMTLCLMVMMMMFDSLSIREGDKHQFEISRATHWDFYTSNTRWAWERTFFTTTLHVKAFVRTVAGWDLQAISIRINVERFNLCMKFKACISIEKYRLQIAPKNFSHNQINFTSQRLWKSPTQWKTVFY